MTALGLRIPIDIPWKRIGVSRHMMDPKICDRERPHPMQPSVAVFEYEPEDPPGEPQSEYRTTYLKITCSVTSYGATNLDRLRRSRIKVGSPYSEWLFHGNAFSSTEPTPFDSSMRLDGADLPCYGALLEVSVGPHGGEWSIDKYPYFSDFEPKKRELYELVSETGEIMSRSLEQTGVLHGGTTSTSSEVFDKDTFGVTQKQKTSVPSHGETSTETGVSYNTESGSRNVSEGEVRQVRTSDAAREARETWSHTTQLTQMYQLLSSFHLGTNRAVFFFEPRPHIVQTEETFIDGPRKLEGVQEFFMVVTRPRTMKSICVDVSLETLHVGVKYPEPQHGDSGEMEVDLKLPTLGTNGSWQDPDKDWPFPADNSVSRPIPPNMEIDFSKGGGKGWQYTKLVEFKDPGGVAKHTVDVTPTAVILTGHVEEFHYEGKFFFPPTLDRRVHAYLEVEIKIFFKPKVAPAPKIEQFAILSNTSVCTCPEGLGRLKAVEGSSIVRELELPPTAHPMGRAMPVREAHHWNRLYNQITRSSLSATDRYPRGAVGFWDLDVMRGPMAGLIRNKRWTPDFAKGVLASAVAKMEDGPARHYLHLVARESDAQVFSEALQGGLFKFADASGLDISDAVAVRRALWDYAKQEAPSERSGDSPASAS